ncbi:MAG: hypothetical protein M3P50_06705 [Actinomycetota bacterium]|nr:hypothetical protein [Actinomycetota bacterium]
MPTDRRHGSTPLEIETAGMLILSPYEHAVTCTLLNAIRDCGDGRFGGGAMCLSCGDSAVRVWDWRPRRLEAARLAYCMCPKGRRAAECEVCLGCGGTGHPIGVRTPAWDTLFDTNLGVCSCDAGREVIDSWLRHHSPERVAWRRALCAAIRDHHGVTFEQAAVWQGYWGLVPPGTIVPEGFFDDRDLWVDGWTYDEAGA